MPRLLAALLFLSITGCVLGEVDFEGKQCPCIAGFECDRTTNTCVPIGSAIGDAGDADASTSRDGGDVALDGGTIGDAAVPDASMNRDGGDDPNRDAGTPDAGAYPECQFDRDCSPPDTICDNETCVPACDRSGGGTCTDPEACVEGRCLAVGSVCSSAKECGDSAPFATCVNGACTQGCGAFSGSCTGNRRCHPDGFCRTAQRCTTDRSCDHPDLVCLDSTCVRRCDRYGGFECRGNATCTDGRCVGANPIGGTCQANADCDTGYCMSIVTPTRQTYCTRPCSATGDCPLDYTCTRVSGAKQCVRETSFSPALMLDTPGGAICMNPGNICQSTICSNDRCVERCSRDGDCDAYSTTCVTVEISGRGGRTFLQQCILGAGSAIGAACSGNAQCSTGICNRYVDVCQAPCCSQSDCGATQICTVYDLDSSLPTTVCQTPTMGAGASAFGAACLVPLDCRSELCAPVDPNNLGGAKACTTYCCTDEDCAVLPGGGRCATFNGPIAGAQTKVCVP